MDKNFKNAEIHYAIKANNYRKIVNIAKKICMIIVSLTILTTVGLTIIIPVKDVNILNGLIQGISQVLNIIGLGDVKPIIVVIL